MYHKSLSVISFITHRAYGIMFIPDFAFSFGRVRNRRESIV